MTSHPWPHRRRPRRLHPRADTPVVGSVHSPVDGPAPAGLFTSAGRAVAVAILFLAAPMLANAQSFMTPTFKLGEARPKTLVLLPPHAQFVKAKVVMTSQMIAESQALEDSAARVIASVLRERGYPVRLLTIEEINADLELQDLVRQLNDRYDEEWPKMVRRPRQVRTGRYGLGDDAVRLGAKLGVDGVVVARIIAVYVTGGRKAVAMIFSLGGSYPRSYTRVDLAVVDGNDGGVESYFSEIEQSRSKTLTRKPEKIMGEAYRKCLTRYPEEGTVLEVSKKELARLAEESDDEDAVDESILADFEALLSDDEHDTGDTDDPNDPGGNDNN